MIIHLFFVFCLFLGFIVVQKSYYDRDRKHRLFINYVTILLILQSGLRNVAVGPDTFAYYLKFVNVMSDSWSDIFRGFITVYVEDEGKDAGYPLLQKIFQLFCNNYVVYLLCVAIVIFCAFRKLLIQFTDSVKQVLFAVLLYWALFYTFFSITGIRQALSVAISIYAYDLIKDRKLMKFLSLAAIAFFIHKSAIIMLPMYYLYQYRNIKVLIAFSFIGFCIFFIFRDYFMNFAREIADYGVFVAAVPWKLMAFYFVASILIFIAFSRYKPKGYIGVFSLYVPTFMWIPLLGNDSTFMREVYYFSVFIIGLLPYSISKVFSKQITSFINMFLMLLFLYLYLQNAGEYKFFWQEMSLPENYSVYKML